MERRLKRSNVVRGLYENKHRTKSHGNDERRGEDGSEDHFHESSAAHRNRTKKDNATGRKSECGERPRTRGSKIGLRCSAQNASKLSASQTNRRPPGSNHSDSMDRTSRWLVDPRPAVRSESAPQGQ